jgi:hypothetical protein
MLVRSHVPMPPSTRAALKASLPGAFGRWLDNLFRHAPRDGAVEEDLRAGSLERLTIEATWVAVGEEHNDEGPILFVGCGEVTLVLFGQWLFDPTILGTPLPEAGFFQKFSLLRASHSGIPFELLPEGTTTLPASGRVPIASLSRLLSMPGKGDTALLLGGELAGLEESLLGERWVT